MGGGKFRGLCGNFSRLGARGNFRSTFGWVGNFMSFGARGDREGEFFMSFLVKRGNI